MNCQIASGGSPTAHRDPSHPRQHVIGDWGCFLEGNSTQIVANLYTQMSLGLEVETIRSFDWTGLWRFLRVDGRSLRIFSEFDWECSLYLAPYDPIVGVRETPIDRQIAGGHREWARVRIKIRVGWRGACCRKNLGSSNVLRSNVPWVARWLDVIRKLSLQRPITALGGTGAPAKRLTSSEGRHLLFNMPDKLVLSCLCNIKATRLVFGIIFSSRSCSSCLCCAPIYS